MMAYLTMMAQRMVELHRVLKPTGSIYLHCDPTASHHLKLLMDAVFGRAIFAMKSSGVELVPTIRFNASHLSMTPFCSTPRALRMNGTTLRSRIREAMSKSISLRTQKDGEPITTGMC